MNSVRIHRLGQAVEADDVEAIGAGIGNLDAFDRWYLSDRDLAAHFWVRAREVLSPAAWELLDRELS